MNKFYSVLAGGLLSVLALAPPAAGQTQPVPPHRTCATEEVNSRIQEELKRLNPGYNTARSTNSAPAYTLRTGATNVTYTLPVIVHVIHNGEAVGTGYNINALQIKSQLDVLNEDYRNTNADGALTPSVYQPVRADMEVQFVPAKYDPNGNLLAEPGIDRVNRNTKGFTAPPYGTAAGNTAYIDNTIKPATYWDPSRYINIWVMDINGGILGYAQFPNNTAGLGGLNTSGGLASTDGVVISYVAYGSRAKYPSGNYGTGTNPYDKGRTLSHELGHWFSLRHIWGDGACATDYCADTPTQQAANFGCVTFPHVTCSNVTGDMSMNYMDYSDDACLYMFTQAQKARLQAVMAVTPRRSELAASAVGCPSLVAATATNSGAACAGTSITLSATGPAGATYAWTGPNGFTSTQQNPILANVTSAMAGEYIVQVSVTTGACSNFASTTVTVNPAPPVPALAPSVNTVCPGSSATLSASGITAATLPRENFNGTATGWTLANSGAATTGWKYTPAPYTYAPLSNYSIDGTTFVLANSDIGGSGSVTNTTLTSPVFSTNGYSSLTLTFQHYLRYISGDVAAVEVTTNGGTTWTAAATYGATQGTTTTPATATVNLNAYINRPAVQVRWRYATSWAWYWALDNVSFSGTVATPTYAWSLVSGDGLPATTTTATLAVTPTQNSVYRLTLSYPGLTCTSTSTVNVNVYPTPTLVTSASPVCAGSTATLSASNLAGVSPAPTYTWSLVSGDGLPAVINTPTISVAPTQNSVYRLTVNYGSSCSLSSTVSVAAVPTPTVVASVSSICAGSTSQLSASNVPTGYTYAWTLVSGNGLPTTTNTSTITVNPTQNSVYRLTVSSGSCSTSSTVSVAAATNSITAYPVPFGDAGLSLQISTCTAGSVSVQILDMLGRRVYDTTVGNAPFGTVTLSLPETGRLQRGKYIVKVQQGSQDQTFNVIRQ